MRGSTAGLGDLGQHAATGLCGTPIATIVQASEAAAEQLRGGPERDYKQGGYSGKAAKRYDQRQQHAEPLLPCRARQGCTLLLDARIIGADDLAE